MAGTFTQAIDNSQTYNVVAQTFCTKIVVRENYDASNPPTANLIYTVPSGSNAVRIPQGTDAVYEDNGRTYSPGEVVGGIRTDAGSITIQRIET